MQQDEEDAQRALQFIAPDKTYSVNIQPAVDSAVASFEEATGLIMTDYNKGNQKAQERMTRVITCPLSVDLEAGYGENITEVIQTVKAIIAAGAVGINIEDSIKQREKSLVDVSFQVELLKAIRETASSMDMPLVINARTDVFLLPAAPSINRGATGGFEEAVQRLNAYRQAGADCLFPIGVSDADTIANLVQAIQGPINIIAGPRTPALPELMQLGVARVSFASGLMRATLAHLRRIAGELLGPGTYTTISEMVPMADLRNCFEGEHP
jgi:2-methylisocitrate lyase-like PEP mutase family enzyme